MNSKDISFEKIKMIPATVLLALGIAACTEVQSDSTHKHVEATANNGMQPDGSYKQTHNEAHQLTKAVEDEYGPIGGFSFDVPLAFLRNPDGTTDGSIFVELACRVADNHKSDIDRLSIGKQSDEAIFNFIQFLSKEYVDSGMSGKESSGDYQYPDTFDDLYEQCLQTDRGSDARAAVYARYARQFAG
jgi:hypothetical protein